MRLTLVGGSKHAQEWPNYMAFKVLETVLEG